MAKATHETIKIQLVALVLLLGCALAFGLARPAAVPASQIDVPLPAATLAVVDGAFCPLDHASPCTAVR